jgi:hypothetical protein
MEARWARTARGWSVALLAGVLTATLHASAGGSFPAPAVVLLAVLLSGIASTCLVGRTPSLPRVAAAVAVGQATFHLVFTTFGSSTGVTLAPVEGSGHAGHGLLLADAAAHGSVVHAGVGMLLAHALAGLASALLLAHSEQAFTAIKRLALLTFRQLAGAPVLEPLPRPRSAGFDSSAAPPVAVVSPGSLRYRGPPAVLRAA